MVESPVSAALAVNGTSEIGVCVRSLAELAGRSRQADLLAKPTRLWEVLQKHRFDVALQSRPVHLLEPIVTARNSQEQEDVAEIAFILLADVVDERIVEKYLAMGATDDLVEDGRLDRDFRSFHVCRAVRTNR